MSRRPAAPAVPFEAFRDAATGHGHPPGGERRRRDHELPANPGGGARAAGARTRDDAGEQEAVVPVRSGAAVGGGRAAGAPVTGARDDEREQEAEMVVRSGATRAGEDLAGEAGDRGRIAGEIGEQAVGGRMSADAARFGASAHSRGERPDTYARIVLAGGASEAPAVGRHRAGDLFAAADEADSAPGPGLAGAAERWARAAWSRLAEPGDAVATKLVAELGPVAALEALRTRGESALDRFRPRLERLDVDRDLEIAERVGARLVVPGDPEWPPGLDDLARGPFCLWARGPRTAPADGVAIVGARAATPYGQRLAADLGAGLAGRGHTVVSGAAFGIDAAAHRGALAVEGPTVAVLACGIDRPYPAAHRDLIEAIADAGLVLTEVAPGSAPTKSRLLQRNRLIATLTRGTLVVEAGLRSGSRHTAGVAADHHRVVMATPGPVTSPASAGCHEMIRAGLAALVTDVDEVLELVGAAGVDLAPVRRGASKVGDDLAPEDRRVFEALARRPRSVDHLARIAGLGEREVTSALGRLALRDLARRDGTEWRR